MAKELPLRSMAFKSGGTYYIFNSSKTGLMAIPFKESSPDYSLWEDLDDLNKLNTKQYMMLAGKTLYVYSTVDDDAYHFTVGTYDVLETTNTSHFMLKGYSNINKIVVSGTQTCKMILSFDNRKNWYKYNTTSKKWESVALGNIYSDGNTVTEINALTANEFKQLFTKNCTIDYAIAISTGEYIESVVLQLPGNSAPTISILKVTANQITHKAIVAIHAEVDDPEGDDMTYKITRTWKNNTPVLLEEGAIDPNSNGKLNYLLDPATWEIGDNIITFTYTDAKNASASASVTVTKVNKDITIAASVNYNKLHYLINDDDHDSGKYKIVINGDVVVDYTSEYLPTPIEGIFDLPEDKIKFGETNTVQVFYKEDTYNTTEKVNTITFKGEYFGLLFVDISNSDPDANGKPNQQHYYSTSLGNLIKYLNIPPVYYQRQSKTYEVGLINKSPDDFSDVTVYSTKINDDCWIRVSDQDPFDLTQDSITFHDVKTNETYPRKFYVKVVSYKDTPADIKDKIIGYADIDKTVKTNS